MKRVISLCCVALIFVFSLAAPVSAAETDSNFFDVLDYTTIDGVDNLVTVKDGSNEFTIQLPYRMGVYYVDMLLVCNGTISAASITLNGNLTKDLTIEVISNRLVRIYGMASQRYVSEFLLTFTTSGATYVNFNQLRFTKVPADRFDIESYCHIVSTLYTNLIHYVPSDEVNYRYVDASYLEDYDSAFTLNLYVTDWQKYDFIDFSILATCESITSVTAYFGDSIIECDVNDWENSDLTLSDFRLYCRLYLTELDRTSSDIPCIVITGQWSPKWINLIQVLGTSGFCITDTVNPLFYYFSMLSDWIDNQTSAIVAAIKGDTVSGDEFQDDVQQELDELDQAQAVMDSVTKPAIDDIDVSVDKYVSQADIAVLAAPMAVFFDSDLFGNVIIMSILLATVSYVLYGKR